MNTPKGETATPERHQPRRGLSLDAAKRQWILRSIEMTQAQRWQWLIKNDLILHQQVNGRLEILPATLQGAKE